MRSIRRRLLTSVVATGAVALAAPISGASAQVPVLPLVEIGGNQIGSAGCVGTNRPAFGGNNGSTSALACGGASFQGPQIGQIGGYDAGPATIDSPFSEVNVSAGSITG